MEYFKLASVTEVTELGNICYQFGLRHNLFQGSVGRVIGDKPFLTVTSVVNWFMGTVREFITVPFVNIDNMVDY